MFLFKLFLVGLLFGLVFILAVHIFKNHKNDVLHSNLVPLYLSIYQNHSIDYFGFNR